MKMMFVAAALSVGSVAALGSMESLQAQQQPALAKGKAQYARCQACHSITRSTRRGIGPNLAGIVGRRAGAEAGFRYSPAMARSNFVWTPEKLNEFLAKPRAVVPGTSMVFAGIPDPAARRALVEYLASSR